MGYEVWAMSYELRVTLRPRPSSTVHTLHE